MMIQLYILGILQRFGPRHGYQIKKIIKEQLADFTDIKLPVIYYHLEKMKTAKLLDAAKSRETGARPPKTIFRITKKGRTFFKKHLTLLAPFEYRVTFSADTVFYFYDSLPSGILKKHLPRYCLQLEAALEKLNHHQKEVTAGIPENFRSMATIIFSHHEMHLRAELDWAREANRDLHSAKPK